MRLSSSAGGAAMIKQKLRVTAFAGKAPRLVTAQSHLRLA
jgi:hypothetical protein